MTSAQSLVREAIGRLIHIVYNKRIRPRLPNTDAQYNGVTVRAAKLFDKYLPWLPDDRPQYEQSLIDGIQSNVSPGDTVVIIGAGNGVSSVFAARNAGEHGEVYAYEASPSMAKRIETTVQRNDAPNVVNVIDSAVETSIEVWNDDTAETHVPASDLPEADVMVIDCEGAEIDVLKALEQTPQTIIVETHGVFGSPTEDVQSVLREMGYDLSDPVVAEPSKPGECRDDDVFVIYAERGN